jgi:hypothetical protein
LKCTVTCSCHDIDGKLKCTVACSCHDIDGT